jgi:hypothetical protein
MVASLHENQGHIRAAQEGAHEQFGPAHCEAPARLPCRMPSTIWLRGVLTKPSVILLGDHPRASQFRPLVASKLARKSGALVSDWNRVADLIRQMRSCTVSSLDNERGNESPHPAELFRSFKLSKWSDGTFPVFSHFVGRFRAAIRSYSVVLHRKEFARASYRPWKCRGWSMGGSRPKSSDSEDPTA